MMKKIFLIPSLAALLCLAGCEKNNRNLHFDYDGPCHCGADNPLEELEWLHDIAVDFESTKDSRWATISVCTYDSTREGFLINACVLCDDGAIGFFDCDGNGLGMLGGIAGIPLSEYNIDPASVREIYRNFPDTAATLDGKRWQLQYFYDRETRQAEVPMANGAQIPFWIFFGSDGQVEGGGINQFNGRYGLYGNYDIYIQIQAVTEIYDSTGWEERLLGALGNSTKYSVHYLGDYMYLYYDQNRKYLTFTQAR